jgi:hypothetical protein
MLVDLAELTQLVPFDLHLQADAGRARRRADRRSRCAAAPPSPESPAVVTSRMRLGGLVVRGARVTQVDRLDPDAALELLPRIIGVDRTRAAPHVARELIELCGRLPLAVCVAGARLTARSKWPISEMVEAMTLERGRLAALRTEDDMAVRGALAISYSGLPAEAARVYRLMGFSPARTSTAR